MFFGDGVHQIEVIAQFALRLVHIVERSARKLKLPARLQRNCAPARAVEEADQRPLVHDRLPAGLRLHALKQRRNAAAPIAPGIGNGAQIIEIEGEFLMLGAKQKRPAGLAALLKPGDQLAARGNRCGV